MAAYYNENEPFAAQFLRNLIAAGKIAPGEVDERSIVDVRADDLRGFTQCHFFAGIGIWSHALRLAGWPDEQSVWTASLPCQPFSSIGKNLGTKDERNLWPTFFELLRAAKPGIVFGEQVAAPKGFAWLAGEVESVQTVQAREEIVRVFEELERSDTENMQGVRWKGDGLEEEKPREVFGDSKALEKEKARTRPCECRKAQGENEGAGIRPGQGRHPEEDRERSLRGDGNCVQAGQTKSMELSISGPSQPKDRLHQGQCESRYFCTECNGQRVGLQRNNKGIKSNNGKAALVKRSLAGEDRGGLEEGSGWNGERSVFSDLEKEAYAVGAIDTCAASVGAPQIRQRLYWVAHSENYRCEWFKASARKTGGAISSHGSGLVYSGGEGPQGQPGAVANWDESGRNTTKASRPIAPASATRGFWANAEWVYCSDGKWRPFEPGSCPLAPRNTGYVGRLRAYGNSIVAPIAAKFISAAMEAIV